MSGPEAPDRNAWNGDYRAGRWDHLGAEREAARYRALARHVTRYSAAPSVLDVGCGRCILHEHLGGPRFAGRYLGVDWAVAALPAGTWGLGHGVVCGQADRLPVRGRFDVIVCSEVLYYLDRPVDLVTDLLCRLTPDGQLLVSLYQPDPSVRPGWYEVVRDLDDRLGALPLTSRRPVRDAAANAHEWLLYEIRREGAAWTSRPANRASTD